MAVDLGISRASSYLPLLIRHGEAMIRNARYQIPGPHCAFDSSGLSLTGQVTTTPSYLSLLLDIGGTHTKCALVSPDDSWTVLFDQSNDQLCDPSLSQIPPLHHFLRSLAERIHSTTRELCAADQIRRLGMIWSNRMESKPFRSIQTQGVTAIVRCSEIGGYRKGEWFLKEVQDGTDVGELLLIELLPYGIIPQHLLCGNDTVFTLFAAPKAQAGVVVSSGANCTIVSQSITFQSNVSKSKASQSDSDDRLIYNSELGGMLTIPEEALSDGDKAFRAATSSNSLGLEQPLVLEQLCAGTWFSTLVSEHCKIAASHKDWTDLAPLLKQDQETQHLLRNQTLSQLLKREDTHTLPLPDTHASLTLLTQHLVDRAGLYAAALSYLSIANLRLEDSANEPVIVSLDSSMARHFPGFLDTLQRTLTTLVANEPILATRAVQVVLCLPRKLASGEEIPVPMQGLHRALLEAC